MIREIKVFVRLGELIILSQENISIVGISTEPLPHLVDEAVGKIMEV